MSDPRIEILYHGHDRLRAVIDATLEGRCGRILVAGSSPPGAALLELGCYRVLGGDAESMEAEELLGRLEGPCEIVVPPGRGWRSRVRSTFGARVHDRSMESFAPGPELRIRVDALARAVPKGYALRAIDSELAASIGPEISPHGIEVLGGPRAFASQGFGWAVLSGALAASAATSYCISSRFVEVAIATHPDHRGRGLATCAASAMVLEALSRRLEPHWNAANPISQRLAARLGFVPVGRCEVLALDFPEVGSSG